MSLQQVPHTCPECYNEIQSGDKSDHHSDCPVSTNWWEVQYGGELICYLCDNWLVEGHHYRLIPVPAIPNLDHDIEFSIGQEPQYVLKATCQECCLFKVIK